MARCGDRDILTGLIFTRRNILDAIMEVSITGPMVPHVMSSVSVKTMNIKIKYVSIGGSVLNVSVIDHLNSDDIKLFLSR